ncbi:hypothetical protein [Natronobacterium texcoconense]|uniref:Uncharacterized protein n=1 Tax=Natronobacterium texcoconense TaxID=1095778 RepID=A0A1H1FYD0_NATTX|nr:hypothetical protein [Natronobacterium texcoconense]SDR05987.1 hypothetical protein SAMN04489842_2172 [Natronobacterium texcoconense]
MSTESTAGRPQQRETSFIETSVGLLTEQLIYKLREEGCSEDAVKLSTSELEALMAHVDGIDADDFERLFDSFEQIRDEELEKYSHYRTLDEIKGRFETMEDDITTATEVIQK